MVNKIIFHWKIVESIRQKSDRKFKPFSYRQNHVEKAEFLVKPKSPQFLCFPFTLCFFNQVGLFFHFKLELNVKLKCKPFFIRHLHSINFTEQHLVHFTQKNKVLKMYKRKNDFERFKQIWHSNNNNKIQFEMKKKEDNFHIIFDRGREPKRLFGFYLNCFPILLIAICSENYLLGFFGFCLHNFGSHML